MTTAQLQNAHWKDDIAILAALEYIPQDIISNVPDERDYFVMRSLIHT